MSGAWSVVRMRTRHVDYIFACYLLSSAENLVRKYSSQATRISTRAEHRFIVKWEDPCHKISMTRSQMLKVQWVSDFQSGSSVLKKVF